MEKLLKKIKKWRDLTRQQDEADDHVRCPECKDQLFACECPQKMAVDILKYLDKTGKLDKVAKEPIGTLKINIRGDDK